MKKTFYYNFFPTKAEEEAAEASNIPYQSSRVLVEIREVYPTPQIDPNNPWKIRKVLTSGEVMTGKLMLSHNDVFDHVFRYWTLDMANHVIMGNKYIVTLSDVTDEIIPMRYHNESIYAEQGPDELYIISCMDFVRNRRISPGDEIGLYWDVRSATFLFKIFRR